MNKKKKKRGTTKKKKTRARQNRFLRCRAARLSLLGSETLQATGEEINPERDVGLHPVAFKDASGHIVPRTNEGGKQPQLKQVSKWRSVLAKNRNNEEKMLIIMKKPLTTASL